MVVSNHKWSWSWIDRVRDMGGVIDGMPLTQKKWSHEKNGAGLALLIGGVLILWAYIEFKLERARRGLDTELNRAQVDHEDGDTTP